MYRTQHYRSSRVTLLSGQAQAGTRSHPEIERASNGRLFEWLSACDDDDDDEKKAQVAQFSEARKQTWDALQVLSGWEDQSIGTVSGES